MIITKIEPQKHRENRCSVFIDGKFAFGMDSVDIFTHKLRENTEISRERLAFVTEKALYAKALDKALQYLRQPRSRAQVEKRLLQEEYPAEVIAQALVKLESYHYIDDEAYARAFIRAAARKNYGVRRIRQELWRRGVSRDLAGRLLEEDPPDQSALALEALAKKYRLPPAGQQEKKRCYDYLCRRGFPFEAARAAVKEFCDGEEDERE